MVRLPARDGEAHRSGGFNLRVISYVSLTALQITLLLHGVEMGGHNEKDNLAADVGSGGSIQLW
jgi:hypothetical protein